MKIIASVQAPKLWIFDFTRAARLNPDGLDCKLAVSHYQKHLLANKVRKLGKCLVIKTVEDLLI